MAWTFFPLLYVCLCEPHDVSWSYRSISSHARRRISLSASSAFKNEVPAEEPGGPQLPIVFRIPGGFAAGGAMLTALILLTASLAEPEEIMPSKFMKRWWGLLWWTKEFTRYPWSLSLECWWCWWVEPGIDGGQGWRHSWPLTLGCIMKSNWKKGGWSLGRHGIWSLSFTTMSW